MRIRALLGMAVLVAVPSLPAFAQVWNTGVYAVLDGGAVMVGEANDVAAEVVTGEASLIGDALPKLGRDWEFTLGAGGRRGHRLRFRRHPARRRGHLSLHRHRDQPRGRP